MPAVKPSYRERKGVSANWNFLPAAAANDMRTVKVLKGCTTHQPKTPPNPLVPKTILFGKSDACTAVAGGDKDEVVVVAFVDMVCLCVCLCFVARSKVDGGVVLEFSSAAKIKVTSSRSI
eukprot:scaffold4927_cov139-Amphora_coffeaeformis.AAC.12